MVAAVEDRAERPPRVGLDERCHLFRPVARHIESAALVEALALLPHDLANRLLLGSQRAVLLQNRLIALGRAAVALGQLVRCFAG
jgi:hypothetical protein